MKVTLVLSEIKQFDNKHIKVSSLFLNFHFFFAFLYDKYLAEYTPHVATIFFNFYFNFFNFLCFFVGMEN